MENLLFLAVVYFGVLVFFAFNFALFFVAASLVWWYLRRVFFGLLKRPIPPAPWPFKTLKDAKICLLAMLCVWLFFSR